MTSPRTRCEGIATARTRAIANQRVPPVAARSVGRVLVELVGDVPRGLAGELAGPDEADLVALVGAVGAFAGGHQPADERVGHAEELPGEALAWIGRGACGTQLAHRVSPSTVVCVATLWRPPESASRALWIAYGRGCG
jgi:hypothetical protein